MTAQEIVAGLRAQPFEPFRISMDNGQAFEIRHPELADLPIAGALYVYQPVKDEFAQVAGPAVTCEI